MADLRDSFLAAVTAYLASGERLQLLTAPTDCCEGRINSGPAGCTYWEPIFDFDETEPDPDTAAACGDCPDRAGLDVRRLRLPAQFSGEARTGDAGRGRRRVGAHRRLWRAVYCHERMRTPLAWRHPMGQMIPADPDRHSDYQPPILHGIPHPPRWPTGVAMRRMVCP